ncbi:DNA replication/repair protein RecF [Piscirickettsia litoralis]|uniref:RecF/RecN/SMC N-terminal domain-containing protein n=1 Tax=Piscirickettsia litoralis TaxID=1891921 RepID=A0ABX3A3G1_9GAMM|nr:hypothetical protein [Piscirickettsia litoralis]ODN43050.1 hypothetical protein BGC07_09135 [Piscirickettsia litoralis]
MTLYVNMQLLSIQKGRNILPGLSRFVVICCRIFFDDCEFELQYYAGWDDTKSLKEHLALTLESDFRRGYTYVGAHRADIKVRVQGRDVAKVLSRGQQKLLVYALKLAQGKTLQSLTAKRAIYLLDDLAAELDADNLKRVLTVLSELGSQVFISGIDVLPAITEQIEGFDFKQFHVERGFIKEVV